MKKILYAVVASMLLAITASCGNQDVFSVQEATEPTTHKTPTSSYAQLVSEIDYLKKLLSDNGISNNAERYPIDISMFEELAKPENQTTMGMSLIVQEHGDLWKAEMEKYYDLLFEALRGDDKELLATSQKKWQAFMRDKTDLEIAVNQANGGGSIMSNIAAGIYNDKHRTRALDLMHLYNQISDYQ